MCGIGGAIGLHGQDVEPATVEAMMRRLEHRGPDARGAWAAGPAALGFRRLSFVDLDGGNQPLLNESGDVAMVCNGEIYNHRALRSELEGRGHRFRTGTDVEVIVHLYEEVGPRLVDRLEGQFAFAIFDTPRRRLLLARDHFGVCPLFYAFAGDELLFASEIEALLADRRIGRGVDLTALDQVLTFPGLLSPRTIVRDVVSLPAGHLLELHDGEAVLSEFWDLDLPCPGDRAPVSEHGAVDALTAALERAVRLRLDADVPIGYYVSGGLDSAVIALLADAEGRAGHAFSVAFDDPQYDETSHQRQLSAGLRAEGSSALVTPQTVVASLRQVVRHSGCPLKETYNAASLVLSGLAGDAGVPGVLSGEGADELFAGYIGHRFDAMRRRRPQRGVSPQESAVRSDLWGDPDIFYEKDYAAHRLVRRHLYAPDVAAAFPDFDCTREPIVDHTRLKGRHHLDQRCYLDFKLRLVDHLVADHGDRMAMANSVEARYPFLDLEVARVAAALPPDLKLRGLTEKFVLRQVAQRIGVPRRILEREKFHFVAPSSASLLQSGSELVDHLLSPQTIAGQGYFDPRAVEALVARYRAPGFVLDLPYEDDPLAVVLTFGCLVEELGLATLG